jgi:hypothetical protein
MANFKVGETVIAKINGIPHETVIRAVLESTDQLIVDFGHEQDRIRIGSKADKKN